MKRAMRAASGLPFLLGAGLWIGCGLLWNSTAAGQTTGLVAPMSGDCTTTATGVVSCTAKGLPGKAGVQPTFNAQGVEAAPTAAPYVANAGPVKVAPFNVSALTNAGTNIGPNATSGFRVVNLSNGMRLLSTGAVTQVKTYIAGTSGATALYFELWRVNSSGTFGLACRSGNLLSQAVAGQANTLAVTGCAGQAGDYPAMLVQGSWTGQAAVFSASTAYPVASYPSYTANGATLTTTEDFLGGTAGTTYTAGYNVPMEVYEANGPVLVGVGDSKMQGTPLSGDYLQAAGSAGGLLFPVAAVANYNGPQPVGTSLIDLSNQPVAWAARVLGYSYANLGVAGANSTVQLQAVLPAALALKPAVMVLSGTVNDWFQSVPTATSLANYKAMYQQAVAAGVQKVVMTGAEPAGYLTEANWADPNIGPDLLNAGLKSFCQAQTACVWIGDQVTAALGQYRAGAPAGSLHNIQPGYAAADNLHWNNAGAQLMGVLEANAIEPPTVAGTAVAVTNALGTATRSRAVAAVSHDGTLGWRWQDTRDYLQMDGQGLDNAAVSAGGAGTPGQQTVGCVVFSAAKGYVRCDGGLSWSQQGQVLTAAGVSAGSVAATSVTGTTVSAGLLKAGNGGNAQVAAGVGGYSSLALNGNHADGSRVGLWGGDPNDANLYVDVPANGAIAFRLGNVIQGGWLGAGFGVHHLQGNGGVPTVTVGAAAASCSVTGTDLALTLQCTTGSAPAAGVVAVVNFNQAYAAAPHFAAPGAGNAASAAAAGSLFAGTTTTALTVQTGTALQAGTSYVWQYVLVQ